MRVCPAAHGREGDAIACRIFRLDPEVYRRYKDEVLKLSNSFQKIDQPGLSRQEIATKLGLDQRAVTEIRCVAERDCYPLDEWEKAIEFKGKACRDWAALALKRPDLKRGADG